MTTIQPNSPYGAALPLPDSALQPNATPPGAQIEGLKLLAELQNMVAQLEGGKGAPGVSAPTNERGAPAIAEPSKSFNASDMVDLLRSLRGKSQDAQLKAAATGVESARIAAEKNNENQMEKVKEWIEKCKEADKGGLLGKIFGWIGKIFAALAALAAVAVAAVATVATGGAAAPFLAMAVIGAIGATMALADQISQEFGGPEISIGNLIQTVVGKFLEACGVPPETAERIGRVMGGVMAIAMPVMLLVEPQLLGGMAQNIALLAGADEQTAGYIGMAVGLAAAITAGIAMAVISGGSSVGTSATKIASALVGASAQIVQGATSVATGGIGIATAIDKRDAENAIAEKKELEAAMVKLQKQMEEGREELKKVIQQIEEGLQMVTKMLAGAADSMSQVTSNIGKRAAV
ncbi:type III secretion system translocon subunit SctE [Bordetella genomosp. 13]|uniref:Outer protein B n=1 Tax=Bordetella genomosp. 13 TaxID=463040 RepID=A0A1W6Z857_9BORD|nr:type III secretion system translocon subunit SctE [Bordetella genomosp. 13]ARP93563.1 outer protein B [Bordetella genomosp. 13]